jgi:hypothetical protein
MTVVQRRAISVWASGLLMAIAVAGGICPAQGERDLAVARPKIGDKLAAMSFKDIRFLPRSLSDLASPKDPVPAKAFVLVFTNSTCPLVQKYLPRLNEMHSLYRERGVRFVSVNVGVNDSILDLATQAVKHDSPFPFVQDIDGSCRLACGVSRTPEAVVIDAEYRLRYRGRIDDQYRLSGTASSANHQDLKNAIEALLGDQDIAVTETPVDGCLITTLDPPKATNDITYTQHVAPLIQKHCNECHQPGTAAPFALQTYEEVISNGAMIAEVVDERRMPPWYASAEFGTFTNCRTLSDRERQTILQWVRAGMPPGAAVESTVSASSAESAIAKLESQATPLSKWQMGEPDWIVDLPTTYSVPADGYVDYKYALLPHIFWRDTWVQGVEILPDNARVVHHCNLGFVTLGGGGRHAKLITGYVPGGGPMELRDGVAARINKGSVLGVQIHLTTTGKPEEVKLRVGFRFAKERVQKELQHTELYDNRFRIPPFDPHFKVAKSKTVDKDVTAFGMFAHMHTRGKDITFRAYPPKQDSEILLMIPNYNFDWQMPYYLPTGAKKYPAGTRFECIAHFDNSNFNPFNPDPSVTVRVGEQTYNEMMYGFIFYTEDDEQLNLAIDPKTGFVERQKREESADAK